MPGKSAVKFVASIHLFLTLWYVATATEKTYLLEAEGGGTTGEVKRRGSASNQASVYLNHGDFLSYNFTTPTECSIVIATVRYSEGSTVDTATVSIDGRDIGSFSTTVSSNSADPWDDFYESGQVGEETTVAAGEHTLRLSVSTTDEYGMEVDYIQLRTTCNITTYASEGATAEDTTTQESTTTEGDATATPAGSDSIEDQSEGSEQKSLTNGEIAGITVALLVGVPSILVAIVVPIAIAVANCRREQKKAERLLDSS